MMVDFWNFQLAWNNLVGKQADGNPIRIPWRDTLPRVLVDAISKKRGEPVTYAGSFVYASYDPGTNTSSGLRRFLQAMDAFPGYAVTARERKARDGKIHCSSCGSDFRECPKCGKGLRRTVEKGIDSAILTDMIRMAHDNIFDVAVLASNDADLASAVTFVQDRFGKHVYNMWFKGLGVTLRNACWDHLEMSELLNPLGIGSDDSGV